MKRSSFLRGLAALALASPALAAPSSSRATAAPEPRLATRQLVLPFESASGFLNGAPVTLADPARVVNGRSHLPLREVARVLALPLELTPQGLRLGRLELAPAAKLARLDGRELPFAEVGAVVDGRLYLQSRALEPAVGARVAFDPRQRTVTLTVSAERQLDPSLPVARFATDKREYRLGEPVRIVEYSYDPDGLPISFKRFTGREDAFFAPGAREIGLVVTNAAGRSSEPFTVRVNVTAEPFLSPRDFALRNVPVGRTFLEPDVLGLPVLEPAREDAPVPLVVSDSPEVPDRSGLLYEDNIAGRARLVAYHLNGAPGPARVLVLATNAGVAPVEVLASRLGETAATRIVSTLGQVSLMDFLTSGPRERVRVEPGRTAALYASVALQPGQGLNLMADLETTGPVSLSVFLVEDALYPAGTGELPIEMLRSLPVLEPDANHVRGTFPAAERSLVVDLAGLPSSPPGQPAAGARLVIGDNASDPALPGKDALTGRAVTLLGNYGVTYRIRLENARGIAVALAPRGGMYSGAVRVQGQYLAVPESGVLLRPDAPLLLYRELRQDAIELEFVPASGSFLPVNLLVYRLEAPAAPPAGASGR